ncbi:hypothetical protein JCM14469_25230 [Desulfatiferula olefinivorans]
MQWYYAVGKERIGPLDEADFEACVASGQITAKTLVWNSTFSGWTRLADVPDYPGKAKEPDPIPGVPVTAPEPIGETARCSECGGEFYDEELVRFENARVCAGCKPLFVQKIREGVSVGGPVYAGFWIRVAAKFIDGLILSVVNMLMGFVMGLLMVPVLDDPAATLQFTLFTMFLQILVAAAYSSLFLGHFSATPGKMACGLKVITADQGQVSYMRGFARYFGELVSGITLGIGYLMAGWDSEKRALHDRICATRVIRVRHL